MRNLILSLSMLIFVSCGSILRKPQILDGPGMVHEPDHADSIAYGLTPESDEVRNAVAEIYAAVEKEYAQSAYGTDSDLAARFCSKAWRETVRRVREKENLTDDICLDADYWVMGQDVSDFHVDSISVDHYYAKEPRSAFMSVKVHNCGQTTPVFLKLVEEDGKWVIDNFIDIKNDLDWRQSMDDYLKGK